MKPAAASAQVREWFEEHGRAVEMKLARSGVPSAADRADLKQEVFMSAFLALISGKNIVEPRAWLKACARKKACNYREKESQRAPHAGEQEVVSTMASPAQNAEDREELCLVFECLDEEMEEVVLSRADGLSWDETALKNRITVARAKYLYTMAVTLMAEALKREDSRTGKRRTVSFPIWLAQVVDALRAEVDNASPELDRRIRENLERFMEAAGAGATDFESERVSIASPSSISIQITPPAPPMTDGTVLGMLGNGILIGIFFAYLSHGATGEKPSPEPRGSGSIRALALCESAERMGKNEAPAPFLSANESRMIPREADTQRHHAAQSVPATVPLKVTLGAVSLIDRARVALHEGNEREALALLSQHARTFPGKQGEEARQSLASLVCVSPAARDTAECTAMGPSSASK